MTNQSAPPREEDEDLQTWTTLTNNIKKLPPANTEKSPSCVFRKVKPVILGLGEAENRGSGEVKKTTKSGNSLFNAAANIDRSTLKKFRHQEFPIEAKLDLHGHTEDQAYNAVFKLIKTSYAQGKRCILIITGKGLHNSSPLAGEVRVAREALAERTCNSGEGYPWHKRTLKDQVPSWLNSDSLSPYILSFIHPAPALGGTGALYILLKRNRD